MLTEPNIDQNTIKAKIEKNYGIKVTKLTHVIAGEASWSYKVQTQNNEMLFFKIHANLTEYKVRFDLTYKLFNNCGIKNITHPIKNKEGGLVVFLDKYPAALFDFISGHNASENELNDDQCFALGKLLGQIHKAKDIIGEFSIKEDFKYGNTDRLLKSIESAEIFLKDDSKYKRDVAELFIKNKGKINTRLEELQELGDRLRKEQIDFVICHGEPHRWNTMADKSGEVFLIDWDDSLFAPKEKDLTVIKGEEAKLNGYRSVVGEFELNQEVIHYYDIEWNISEIDAWSSQILYDNTSDLQNQHDLEFFISELERLSTRSL